MNNARWSPPKKNSLDGATVTCWLLVNGWKNSTKLSFSWIIHYVIKMNNPALYMDALTVTCSLLAHKGNKGSYNQSCSWIMHDMIIRKTSGSFFKSFHLYINHLMRPQHECHCIHIVIFTTEDTTRIHSIYKFKNHRVWTGLMSAAVGHKQLQSARFVQTYHNTTTYSPTAWKPVHTA